MRVADSVADVRARGLTAAFDDARREGRIEGRVEGERAVRATLGRALDEAAAALHAAREEALDEVPRAVAVLATAIARQLLAVELDAGRYDVEAMVRETLAASGVGRGSCTVHLHPADASALESCSFRAATKVEADEDVPRGHVHVTTPDGLVVRDLDAALDAIRERLLGELRR